MTLYRSYCRRSLARLSRNVRCSLVDARHWRRSYRHCRSTTGQSLLEAQALQVYHRSVTASRHQHYRSTTGQSLYHHVTDTAVLPEVSQCILSTTGLVATDTAGLLQVSHCIMFTTGRYSHCMFTTGQSLHNVYYRSLQTLHVYYRSVTA